MSSIVPEFILLYISTMILSPPSHVRSYAIGNEIGQGAFSRVFSAVNLITKSPRAIKVIHRSSLTHSQDSQRVHQEISILSHLHHSHLICLKETFTDDKFLYIVLNLCEGGDLFKYILNQGHLDEPTSALVFSQILSAVAFCHSHNIVHRDLKLENVLITTFPTVQLSDFGLSGFVVKGERMTVYCGSPCYLAPECHCKIAYDGIKADIWSLGVMLFAMVTGSFPWAVTNSTAMVRQILKGKYDIPKALSMECRSLINGMLQVNPGTRLTMAEVLEHPFLKQLELSPFYRPDEVPSLKLPVTIDVKPEEILGKVQFATFSTVTIDGEGKGKCGKVQTRRMSHGLVDVRSGQSGRSWRGGKERMGTNGGALARRLSLVE
jgi:serine/threonine protein kinase